MMDWTDRHCRAFHRVMTRRALLYTEMAVDQAVIHGDARRMIGFDAAEHPVAIQLGGSDPKMLSAAARIAEHFGYAEVNLNVGCPSDRVQSGTFGACLMREPQLVADCLAAMREAVSVPVTVKHRLGVDEQDPEETLFSFVETVAQSGVTSFSVHARKAWLKGLSPKENRDIPPLDYDIVRRLKVARPDLEIILNGGLENLEHAHAEMAGLDGVMLGRAAYHTPFILSAVDSVFFGEAEPTGPIPPSMTTWALPLDEFECYTRDLDRARALLADAGYPNGFSSTMIGNAGNASDIEQLQVMAEQFAEIGIQMEIRQIEWGEMLELWITQKNFDTLLIGSATGRDPDANFYRRFLSTDTRNTVGFNDPHVDELLKLGRTTVGFDARYEIYAELQRIITTESPKIFTVQTPLYDVVWDHVQNWNLHPMGMFYMLDQVDIDR